MRHPKQIEAWQRMTPAQRMREFFALMEASHRYLLSLPEEERKRRYRYLLEKHEREEGGFPRVRWLTRRRRRRTAKTRPPSRKRTRRS